MLKRDFILLLAAVFFALVISGAVLAGDAAETGSWGLKFNGSEPPTGSAAPEKLRELDAAFLDTSGEKVLYLTFDAGYENGFTSTILDTLNKQEVSAAFFLAGNYLERNPELVQRMTEEGHIVGNHTMHHYDMSKIAEEGAFRQELESLSSLYKEITGQEMEKYYRPPQGIFSEENLKMAKNMGYKTVFWSLAYADWDNDHQLQPDKALEKVLSRTHDGAVILLHATSKTNAAILDALITQWKRDGYRFGTLEELFGT